MFGFRFSGFRSLGEGLAGVLDIDKRAVGVEDDAEGDFLDGVAGGGEVVVLFVLEAVVKLIEGLKDHASLVWLFWRLLC